MTKSKSPDDGTSSPSEPKYPDVHVQLTGQDGNAFNIIGLVQRALRRAGKESDVIDGFIDEATASDYDHLLQTCMKWVDVA